MGEKEEEGEGSLMLASIWPEVVYGELSTVEGHGGGDWLRVPARSVETTVSSTEARRSSGKGRGGFVEW